MKTKDLSGQRFGRLLVTNTKESRSMGITQKRNKIYWLCVCDCGNTIFVLADCLKSGNTKSCGCLNKETRSKTHKKYNIYDLSGEYGIGYDTKGKEFYFDLEDYEKIKDYCWRITTQGYARAYNPETKSEFFMHNFLCPCEDNKEPDHRNRIRNDNRKNNLLPKTRAENIRNSSKKSTNKSGFIGVCWNKNRGKWIAYITLNKHLKNLGYFIDKDEAVVARLKAEFLYFKGDAPQRHLFEQYKITEENLES